MNQESYSVRLFSHCAQAQQTPIEIEIEIGIEIENFSTIQ